MVTIVGCRVDTEKVYKEIEIKINSGSYTNSESAKNDLKRLSISYTEESFLNHVRNGDTIVTHLFLVAGMSPNIIGHGGKTPLMYALENQDDRMIKLLIFFKADNTFLVDFALEGHWDKITDFINTGANLKNIADHLLILAINDSNNVEVDKILISGADPNYSGPLLSSGHQSILEYALKKGNVKAVEALLQNGAHRGVWYNAINAMPSELFQYGYFEMIEVLLSNGATANVKYYNNTTPLHIASSYGYFEIVELLIKHRANINIKDDSGITPLMRAAYNGNIDIMKFLIDNRALVNDQDNYGNTSLFYAASSPNIESIKILLDSGADVNKKDYLGRNPLRLTIDVDDNSQNWDGFVLLLKAGGDPNFLDDYGNPPLVRAADSGQVEVVRLLLQKGVFYDKQNPSGKTALMYAVEGNHIDVVKELLNAGADALVTDNDGLKALDYAIKNNLKEIINLLESYRNN
jgi:ankyrin repeat protein